MTIAKMRAALTEHCANLIGCDDCPLKENSKNGKGCNHCASDKQVVENYHLVFGGVEEAHDNVNHPSHYNQGKFECIDVMVETFGVEATQHFCVLNAFKYIWRSKQKGGVSDLEKAINYLNKYLELEGASDDKA